MKRIEIYQANLRADTLALAPRRSDMREITKSRMAITNNTRQGLATPRADTILDNTI
jgi:hypothetical protein